MKTFHLRQKAQPDGQLRLDIPVGKPNAECDIVVVVEPPAAPTEWLPDFWQQLSRGWQGERLTRPPQGQLETRTSLQ